MAGQKERAAIAATYRKWLNKKQTISDHFH